MWATTTDRRKGFHDLCGGVCFSTTLLQPAITLRCLFQRLFGDVLLIKLAAGDDALRRAVSAPQAYQCPTLHLVGLLEPYQASIWQALGRYLSRIRQRAGSTFVPYFLVISTIVLR